MKSKPILFSPAMVRAILDGRKTQTRRIYKEALSESYGFTELDEDGHAWFSGPSAHRGLRNPYGQPGSQLWIQESHRLRRPIEATESVECSYAEDGEQQMVPLQNSEWVKMMCRQNQVGADYGAIIPGRFMYKSLSRITLEITGIRVERLQDISEEDAVAEGCPLDDAVYDYEQLWKRINGPGSWESNPWVWVVGFRRIKP